jgi:hypothetical protein
MTTTPQQQTDARELLALATEAGLRVTLDHQDDQRIRIHSRGRLDARRIVGRQLARADEVTDVLRDGAEV